MRWVTIPVFHTVFNRLVLNKNQKQIVQVRYSGLTKRAMYAVELWECLPTYTLSHF